MGIQQDLNALAGSLTVSGGPASVPPYALTVALSPDPTAMTLSDAVAGVQRITSLLKFVRFSDDSMPDPGTAISDFISTPGKVLGGQAVPAITVQLPGPALPGARIPVLDQDLQTGGTASLNNLAGLTITGPTATDVPAPPPGTLPGVPGLDATPPSGADVTKDVLAGVPGILAAIEIGVADALKSSVGVNLTWTLNVTDSQGNPVGQSSTLSNSPVAALTVIPPIVFCDVTAPQTLTLSVSVSGTLTAGTFSATFGPLTVAVPFQAISLPRLAVLCTWPKYGTQATSDDNNPDDNSSMLLLPANMTLDQSAVTQAVSDLQQAMATLRSFVHNQAGPAVAVLDGVNVVLGLLGGLNTGLSFLLIELNRQPLTGHADYVPLKVAFASPTTASPTFGGFADLNGIWWDAEWPDHDYYHDHSKSWLFLAPKGGMLTIFCNNNFVSSQAMLTLTAGDVPIVGIPDFRNSPATFDSTFSPSGLMVPSVGLTGSFSNSTDSVLFT